MSERPLSRAAIVLGAMCFTLGCAAACSKQSVSPPQPVASARIEPPDATASIAPPPVPVAVDAAAYAYATPTDLSASTATSFETTVEWKYQGRDHRGFELQVKKGDDFVRAALVNPNKRAFDHHLRWPGETVTYRLRAFGERGESAFTAPIDVTMPDLKPARVRVRPSPCQLVPRAPATSGGCNPNIEVIDDGSGNVVHNVPSAGNACRRRLFGNYAGCMRELGVFELQADIAPVPGLVSEGFPVLRAVAGAGQYVGATLLVLQLTRGRYMEVDEATICGETSPDAKPSDGVIDDDLAKCRPPFPVCQLDHRW